jgi:hypothetical protein
METVVFELLPLNVATSVEAFGNVALQLVLSCHVPLVLPVHVPLAAEAAWASARASAEPKRNLREPEIGRRSRS